MKPSARRSLRAFDAWRTDGPQGWAHSRLFRIRLVSRTMSGRDHGREARAAYERAEYQKYLRMVGDRTSEIVIRALRVALDPHEASVTARLKEPESFGEKASRWRDGEPRYLRPLSSIHDQVGLRVVVLHVGYLAQARDLIQASPDLIVEEYDDKSVGHSANHSFGYHGVHLAIQPVSVSMAAPAHAKCGSLERVEIQVRTQAQHTWAEVEHRLRYKNDVVNVRTSRGLDQAAALLEVADEMLRRLTERTEERQSESPVDLGGRAVSVEPAPEVETLGMLELLNRRFPDAAPPTPVTLRWIERCAASLPDCEDPAVLNRKLDTVPLQEIERIFEAVGHSSRSQARQLDDALLWIGRERYIDAAEHGVGRASERIASGRSGVLRWRLALMEENGILPSD